MPTPLTIWTIGHSIRSFEELLQLLQEHRIQTLVDVRHFPGSRRFPHFNKAHLAQALPAAGIRYEHLVDLGGRRPPRPDSPNLLWRHPAFRGYADYMQTPPYQRALTHLLDIAKASRTAIMCSESLWWRCHRSMIADDLKSRGVQVLHILAPHKVQEHPYTSAAQIIDGHLSYEPPLLSTPSQVGGREAEGGGFEALQKPAPSRELAKPIKERPAPMPTKPAFKVGDHVEWNSEAGKVRGTIQKRITKEITFKNYTVHASKEEPQYLIKSDKTDHLAMHKGSALQKVKKPNQPKKKTK